MNWPSSSVGREPDALLVIPCLTKASCPLPKSLFTGAWSSPEALSSQIVPEVLREYVDAA